MAFWRSWVRAPSAPLGKRKPAERRVSCFLARRLAEVARQEHDGKDHEDQRRWGQTAETISGVAPSAAPQGEYEQHDQDDGQHWSTPRQVSRCPRGLWGDG